MIFQLAQRPRRMRRITPEKFADHMAAANIVNAEADSESVAIHMVNGVRLFIIPSIEEEDDTGEQKARLNFFERVERV